MTARRLLVVVGSFALLIGAMLSALQFTQLFGNRPEQIAGASLARDAATAPSGPAILAAGQMIAAGTLLRPQDVVRRQVSASENVADLVPADSEADIMGAVVRRDIPVDQPLLSNDIVRPGDRGFLAAVLTPGMRAVSIPVGSASSTAGLMAPGDRIDVVLMQNFAPDGPLASRKSVGETVLRDIRVIAIDQTMGALPRPAAAGLRGAIGLAAPPPLPLNITLEVTERQAQIVFVALELGKVELSLRSFDGKNAAAAGRGADADRSTWADDVSPALRSLERREAPAAAPRVAQPKLDITRGMKTESECVMPSGAVQPCGGATP